MIYILLAIILLVVGSYVKRNWKSIRYRNDIDFPPSAQRKNLYYGYYSCLDEQVAETKDHINLLHESQFNGPEKCVKNILDARVDVSLDVSPQVFEKLQGNTRFTVRQDAFNRLDEFFQFLANNDALKYVKILYPIDEPNTTVLDAHELLKAIDIIKTVAQRYALLSNVKYAVIYAYDNPFICQDYFDYLGYDDYGIKSNILVSDQYLSIKNNLKPHQKTILVPGGAYGQDPKPFLNYANSHEEVGIIMPFLWFDDQSGNVKAKGIRSNGMKDEYVKVGKACTES